MIKILVVEDEALIRDELLQWLQFEGYTVEGAPNGRIGLELAQQNLPDLILSDISMPEMNGHELLLEVHANPYLRHIPFIFLTASAEHEAMRKGMEMGADDYLTKPFTYTEVLNAIRSRLEKKEIQNAEIQAHVAMFTNALNEEREKRLLKSRIVAMFSHDFRNPLASILSSATILKNYEDRLTSDRRHRHLDYIDGAVRLLIQMLDDMLTVAEMESGHLIYTPQEMDVDHFVTNLLDEFRQMDQNAHPLILQSTLANQFGADPKLLRQILANLVSNAIKYSPSASKIMVSLKAENSWLEIGVSDQGIGISPEDVTHLFEPFYRATNAQGLKGTGLGLAIVKQAVDLYGGSIAVESVLNQGTRFTIRLPYPEKLE